MQYIAEDFEQMLGEKFRITPDTQVYRYGAADNAEASMMADTGYARELSEWRRVRLTNQSSGRSPIGARRGRLRWGTPVRGRPVAGWRKLPGPCGSWAAAGNGAAIVAQAATFYVAKLLLSAEADAAYNSRVLARPHRTAADEAYLRMRFSDAELLELVPELLGCQLPAPARTPVSFGPQLPPG
jgi:hypothetical protein